MGHQQAISVPLVGLGSIKHSRSLVVLTGYILISVSIHTPASQDLVMTSNSNNAIQVLFEAAELEFESSRYLNAISIYEVILKQEDSVRVKLEIAHAYYLAGQFRTAKKYFRLILSSYALPANAESRVRYYLEQIDRRIGKFTMGFHLVSNSNPKNITYEDEVVILGESLTIVKSKERPKTLGVNLSMSYDRRLPFDVLSNNKYRANGYLKANMLQYENNNYRSALFDGGFITNLPALDGTSLSIGATTAFENDINLNESYYAAIRHEFKAIKQLQISHKMTLSKVDVNNSVIHDSVALNYEASVGYQHQYGHVNATLGFERSRAKASPYSYLKRKGEVRISGFSVGRLAISGGAGLYIKQYGTNDPLFGKRRMDGNLRGDILLGLRGFSIGNMVPQVGFSREYNLSNINLYAYRNSETYLRFSSKK